MRKFKHQVRRLLLVIPLLIIAVLSEAQQIVDTTFHSRMSFIFQQLEKHRVPHGLLLDHALEYTNLSNFNGSSLTDSNKVMPPEYWEIYKTLYFSRIHSNGLTIQSPAVADSLWFNQRQYGKIVLAGLYYNYSRFRDDAVSGNRLTIQNDQLIDKYILGVWQNPYQEEKVFAVAPSIEYYEGKSLQVVLPSNLWQTNASGDVSNITIDLGDGLGYRSITPGTPLNVTYTDTGTKTWKYCLQRMNGQYLYSHSIVRIKPAVIENACSNCRFGSSNPEVLPFTATESYLGSAASGRITIRYRDPDLGLRRPLIVVEGFDPGHIMSPELLFGVSNINDFIFNVQSSNSLALNADLLGSTRDYDLIYVDWDNGTDYLQRNAYLLETIISWVNANKEPLQGGGFADNVVMGLSMGGVIGRYALRDMEVRLSLQHNTRLFVSVDAPHQGANVPVAYQHLARHMRDLYIRTGVTAGVIELIQFFSNGMSPFRALSLSDRPAARQMLINWVNSNGAIDNSMHDTWQTELRNLGFPTQDNIRNIAISNGSECATTQPFSPGATLFSLNGRGNTRFIGDLLGQIAFPVVGSLLNWPSFLLGILPGKNTINFEFLAKAQPHTGTTQQIYLGKITYTKKLFWVVSITTTITNRSQNSDPSLLPMDYYAGGQINTGINPANINLQNILIKFNTSLTHIPTFNFIPVPSAIDLGSNNVTLTHSDYLTPYVGANPPTGLWIDNFITAYTPGMPNEGHIAFMTRNGDWLASELSQTGNPPPNPPSANCSSLCGISISGLDAVCDATTFTVPSIPGATVIWGASNNFLINSFPSGNSYSITRRRPGSATIIITANITVPGCGTTTLTKTIQYGVTNTMIIGPYDITQHTVMGVAYVNTTYYFVPYEWSSFFPPSSYTWTLFPPTGNPTLYSGTQPYITFSEVGQHTLQVSKMTTCGPIVSQVFINVQENYGWKIVSSPNPVTSGMVTLSLTELGERRTKDDGEPFIVSLYDINSTIKYRQWTFKEHQSKYSLNIGGIRKGIYILNVRKGKKEQSSQLIIQ